MFNVKLNDSTIRERLNKFGLFGRDVRIKPLLSKMCMAAQLGFAKLHLKKKTTSQDLWNDVLWTDKTKVEISGHNV